MRAFFASVVCAAAVMAPGFADDTNPTTPTTTAAAPQPESDPVVCKKLGAPTGTRLGDREVCLKASEWEKHSRHDRDAVDKRNSGPSSTGH
jgi:hypothetical protein